MIEIAIFDFGHSNPFHNSLRSRVSRGGERENRFQPDLLEPKS